MPTNRCLLIAVSILALLLPAASATAATPSQVVISYKLPAFNGVVKSSKACRKNRTVKLYRAQPGPDKLLGTDKTNKQGKWLIPAKLKSGNYWAKTTKRGTCGGDRSGFLPVA